MWLNHKTYKENFVVYISICNFYYILNQTLKKKFYFSVTKDQTNRHCVQKERVWPSCRFHRRETRQALVSIGLMHITGKQKRFLPEVIGVLVCNSPSSSSIEKHCHSPQWEQDRDPPRPLLMCHWEMVQQGTRLKMCLSAWGRVTLGHTLYLLWYHSVPRSSGQTWWKYV